MEQQVHFITLGLDDMAPARRFYVDGLGWRPAFEVPGEVSFIQVAPGVLLSLWNAEAMAADIGVRPRVPVTLAQNTSSDDGVRRLTERAVAAGATVLKEPQRADFGGFHAMVADPAGFVWELAHNPGWRVEADGTVVIGPIG